MEDEINKLYHQHYPEIHKICVERDQKLKQLPHFWKTALLGNPNLMTFIENDGKETETALDSLISIDLDYPADSDKTYVLTLVSFYLIYSSTSLNNQLLGI